MLKHSNRHASARCPASLLRGSALEERAISALMR
jgi:hypothetical protein